MARGASARLGGHIADSPAHPGTPRHSSIITSPRMTTPGHSSRAASPGHLIVQTPLSGNRIVSSRCFNSLFLSPFSEPLQHNMTL